ncbi:hypothetical protein ABKN59_002017 [Abortiporus biennis]
MISTQFSRFLPIFISVCSVAAQFSQPRRRRSIAGSVIAGIVVASACGLLILLFCCLMCGHRRRQARTNLLPVTTAQGGGHPQNNTYNQNGYNAANQGDWNNGGVPVGNSYQPPSGPPPYPGKENYQTQTTEAGQGGFAGGFAPPLGPPPAAHTNNNGRFGWMKGRG